MLVIVSALPCVQGQEDQTITVGAAKQSYSPGQEVVLNGTVTGAAGGQLVAVQVRDEKGSLLLIRTVQAGPDGRFSLEFKMPQYAAAGPLEISASARINGYVVTQGAVQSAVPEFPYSGLVLAASLAVLVAAAGRLVPRTMYGT